MKISFKTFDTSKEIKFKRKSNPYKITSSKLLNFQKPYFFKATLVEKHNCDSNLITLLKNILAKETQVKPR